jgi:hypothetical protein
MKNYTLSIVFATRTTVVSRLLADDKEAKFWMQLCLDICGRDENGIKYVSATLTDSTNTVVATK